MRMLKNTSNTEVISLSVTVHDITLDNSTLEKGKGNHQTQVLPENILFIHEHLLIVFSPG